MEKDYLKNLLLQAETKLLICMFKDSVNYDFVNNKINKFSFINSSCQFMLEVVNDMYDKLGYSNIDKVSLMGYCERTQTEKKDEIIRMYDNITSLFNDDRFDFDGVFEEYSMICSTYKFHNWVNTCGGIDEVAKKLLKLKNMEEVNQVIEGRLLEFFNTGTADASIKDTNITDIIDDKLIYEIENKENIIETIPLLEQFRLLNSITKGFVRGVTGLGGESGAGKSSMMYSIYVMSLLENSKSKICIYANEQTAKVFTLGMIFAFISQIYNMKQSEFKNAGFISLSRDRFISGKFDSNETKNFISMLKIFKSRYRNRITHSYFEDMTPNALKRDIRKKVKSGHKFFFYDTFKDNDEDYSKMMKLASTFDQMTKKYPIHAFMSLQLSDESKGVKYLTNKCLASARGTKRIMETLILFRKLDLVELPTLKVHKLGHPDSTVSLDLKNKNYYALFIDKNRNGQPDIVIIMEIYLDILKYKEIGVVSNFPKDDFKNNFRRK